MNSSRGGIATTRTKFSALTGALAALLVALCAASAATAADRFLAKPVPVLPDQTLPQANGDHALSMAPDGDATALWGSFASMEAATRPADGAFGAPTEIGDGTGTGLPQLATAPDGATIAVWRTSVLGTQQVMGAIRPAGSAAFGPAFQISSESVNTPNLDPQVGIDGDGTALVVWKAQTLDGDPESTRIKQRYVHVPGGPIDAPGLVSGLGTTTPTLTVGPSGDSLVGWRSANALDSDPVTMYQGPNGANPDYQTFDENSGTAPYAAIDAAGNAVVAYNDGGSLKSRSRPAGLGTDFGTAEIVEPDGVGPVGPAVLETDASGQTTILYSASAGADQRSVQTAVRPPGGATEFGAAETIDTPGPGTREFISLAVSGGGAALAGWTLEDGRTFAAARPAGAEFGPPSQQLNPAGSEGATTQAAIDDAGQGVVSFAWRPDNGETEYLISALPYDSAPELRGFDVPASVQAGRQASFSVVPQDPWSPIATVAWSFGDGGTGSGTKPTHAFAAPGTYTVTVTATDADGNSSSASKQIQVTPAAADGQAPAITGARMLRKRFRASAKPTPKAASASARKPKKGSAFLFTLSEAADVRVAIVQRAKGVTKGKRCVKPAGRKGRRCTRLVLKGTLVRGGLGTGAARVDFSGRIGSKKLAPGGYRATIVATDAAGNASAPARLSFTIAK